MSFVILIISKIFGNYILVFIILESEFNVFNFYIFFVLVSIIFSYFDR